MIVNPGLIRSIASPRYRLNHLLLTDGNTVADYRPGNYTGTLNASAWANSIGAAPSLVQATGANQPAIQSDGSLLFDGVAHFMANSFTLNQPKTFYFVMRQITWTSNDYFLDGGAFDTQVFRQVTSSPNIGLYAGVSLDENGKLALNTYGVITAVFNGVSSSLKIDQNSATAGNVGASNATGLTVGSRFSGLNPANVQFKEIIIRSGSDNAATQAQIQSLLKTIYGTP